MTDAALPSLLAESSIRLFASATDRFDAVRQCGQALLDAGAVEESYIDAMLQREQSVSTFVGEGVAIPHGTLAGKEAVKHDALVVLRFPDGVDWEGNRAQVCVGIAAAGGGHIALLSQLAEILLDPAKAEQLRSATEAQQVYDLLTPDEE
ncbi:MAG: mannitol system component [Microbacteriaceae bacterium]|nr:mannitol system component [Microbacteriaceae bacterium]